MATYHMFCYFVVCVGYVAESSVTAAWDQKLRRAERPASRGTSPRKESSEPQWCALEAGSDPLDSQYELAKQFYLHGLSQVSEHLHTILTLYIHLSSST